MKHSEIKRAGNGELMTRKKLFCLQRELILKIIIMPSVKEGEVKLAFLHNNKNVNQPKPFEKRFIASGVVKNYLPYGLRKTGEI